MTGETVALKDILADAMNLIEMRATDKHAVTGVGTGYYELDDITGGFQPGQLVIVAARPSMGKTAFALNVCDHAAVTQKIPVLFVSLEMGQMELADAACSAARSKVDGHKLRTGHGLGNREMKQLRQVDTTPSAPRPCSSTTRPPATCCRSWPTPAA